MTHEPDELGGTMTPTEQDSELREKLDRLIIENQSEDGSIDISDQRAMRDEILELITADRERVALEARIDELSGVRGWTDYDADDKYSQERFHVVPYSYLTSRLKSLHKPKAEEEE